MHHICAGLIFGLPANHWCYIQDVNPGYTAFCYAEISKRAAPLLSAWHTEAQGCKTSCLCRMPMFLYNYSTRQPAWHLGVHNKGGVDAESCRQALQAALELPMSPVPSHSLRPCSSCDGIYAKYMGLWLCAQRYVLHRTMCCQVYQKPWSAPQDGIVSLQPGQGTLTPSAHTTPAKLASGPTAPAPRWTSRKINLGHPANLCSACILRAFW